MVKIPPGTVLRWWRNCSVLPVAWRPFSCATWAKKGMSSNLWEVSWTLQRWVFFVFSSEDWSFFGGWSGKWRSRLWVLQANMGFQGAKVGLEATKHVDFDAISILAAWDLVPGNRGTETENLTHEQRLKPSVPSLLGKMWWTHLARMWFQQRWSCNLQLVFLVA